MQRRPADGRGGAQEAEKASGRPRCQSGRGVEGEARKRVRSPVRTNTMGHQVRVDPQPRQGHALSFAPRGLGPSFPGRCARW